MPRSTPGSISVDELPQFLARLEVGNLLGRHHHSRARLGVAAGAAVALTDAEATEPAQLDLVAAVEGLDGRGEDGVHDHLGMLAGEVGDPRDFLDQLGLGHGRRWIPDLMRNPYSLRLSSCAARKASPRVVRSLPADSR